jgi:hypothetical protein
VYNIVKGRGQKKQQLFRMPVQQAKQLKQESCKLKGFWYKLPFGFGATKALALKSWCTTIF